MKNLLFGLIATFLILSCSDDREIDSNDSLAKVESLKKSNSTLDLYHKILKEDNLSIQRQIVSSFDFTTQSALFQLKFDNFLLNNQLNNEQIEFINYLKIIFNPSNFELVKNRDSKILKLVDDISNKSIQLFGENEGWYLINSFENVNQTIDKLNLDSTKTTLSKVDPHLSDEPECECQNSKGCKSLVLVNVGGGKDSVNFGLEWKQGNCEQGKCVKRQWSIFGITIIFNDTGMCVYSAI